jgi:hypothetical protein
MGVKHLDQLNDNLGAVALKLSTDAGRAEPREHAATGIPGLDGRHLELRRLRPRHPKS